ncbi:hypothetical protein FACS189434_08370 [Bacteroidia bacterium]|nr:hypothetical protein FACS189434_08370 [Bacteroidia bacterium]
MAKNNIHIDDIIVQELAKQERPVNWLARKLGKDTSNFHKQLRNNFMDINLLWDIADTLNYDIFAALSVKFQKRPPINGKNIP